MEKQEPLTLSEWRRRKICSQNYVKGAEAPSRIAAASL